MANLTKAALVAQVNANIEDNNSGLITAADVRGMFIDMVDSLHKQRDWTYLPTTEADMAMASDIIFVTITVGADPIAYRIDTFEGNVRWVEANAGLSE